ncbi:hypothetical protein [Nonomuraea sp. NPDC052265]|uniref:hypothetical protein n=1 Tax=Nonomuraea sp. NPDC052265 TaxID=3364374 RepID=UPI0037C9918D
MCKRTIAVFGLTAVGLLAAAGPATAEEAGTAAAPCVAARVEIAGGPSVVAGTLLDTSAVRTFLRGLLRPADRPGALPLSADASFVEAAEFPGVLDAFLLDVEDEVGVTRTDGDPGDVGLTDSDSDALSRRILEPIVADAMGCVPPTGSSPTGSSPTGSSATASAATDPSATDSADVGSSAEEEPTSLLDAAGATAVLEALVNRPETCVTDGASTIRASDTGMSITTDSSQVSLLDALGVRRTLDVLVGRPSACATENVPLSAATTEQDRPTSLLDGLGLGTLFSRLLG